LTAKNDYNKGDKKMYRIKRKVKINGVVRTVHCMVIPEKKRVIANLRGCSIDAI
jgi:hypothetical protein